MSTFDPRDINIFGADYNNLITDSVNSYKVESKIDEFESRLKSIEERLSIIVPDNSLHEKYPALKEAYDHYKLIEGLVKNRK